MGGDYTLTYYRAQRGRRFTLSVRSFSNYGMDCMNGRWGITCDMIKRNESDVGDVVFEILVKTLFKFLCFILFVEWTNPL